MRRWRATDGDWAGVVTPPLWAFGGSALLAALLAAAVAWTARRLDLSEENASLLLLGLVLLALSLAQWLQLSTLLVPLLAGVLLRNSSPRAWVWPRHFGSAGGVLALLMFVIVGSAVTAESLSLGIGLALALLATRALAKLAAVLLLAPASGLRLRQGAGLALTLAPMSSTVLVLLLDLQAQPLQGGALALALPALLPIMLSAIAVAELLGPCAVQLGLWLAREQPPALALRARPGTPAEPAGPAPLQTA